MDETEVKRYKNYKRDMQILLACSGLWPNYEKYPWAVRTALSIFTGLVSFMISYGVLSFCLSNITNLPVLSRGVGALISYVSIIMKVYFMSICQKELHGLNKGVSSVFERDLQIPDNRPHLLFHLRTFTNLYYFYKYLIIFNVIVLVTMPLTQVKHGRYLRAYPVVTPFSYEPGGVVHWMLYGLELIFSVFLCSVTIGVDSFLGLYALHIVGEVRLLATRLRSLKIGEGYKEELKACIDRHTQLLESHHVLEDVFGFLVVWLAVTCAIVLCFVVFQISQATSFSPLKIFFLITYTGLKLIQAYCYAWFGNIMNSESKECLDSIYDGSWVTSGNTSFMKDVLIILAQRPISFRAKGIMLLDYTTFAKIVNTSVSYFFLIKTLEETFYA